MDPLTAEDICARLRDRYRPPMHALFEQVRNGTGFAATNTADAVVMGLWPSRGLLLEGFEIKCYRGDWLRELKKPEKAEAVMSYCDRIWVVTSTPGMIKDFELPAAWGLMEVHGDGLRVKVQAPDRHPPERVEPDRLFLASLMRNAHAWLERELSNADRTKEAREAGKKEGEEKGERDLSRIKSDLDAITDAVKRFEEASGVEIGNWRSGEVGAAVKMVLKSRHLDIRSRLENTRAEIDRVLAVIDDIDNTRVV